MSDSESTKETANLETIDDEHLNVWTESNLTSDDIVIDRNRRQSIISLSHQPKQVDSKRKYILNTNNIKSFDDFYEFLLTRYDLIVHNTHRFQSDASLHPANLNNFIHNSSTQKYITWKSTKKNTTNSFDFTNNLPPRPVLESTGICNIGATRLTDDGSEKRSTVALYSKISHNTSNLD